MISVYLLLDLCKIFVRLTSIGAAINVGSFHPTLYVNKRRTKKLYKLYTKPYILFVILLIISELHSV